MDRPHYPIFPPQDHSVSFSFGQSQNTGTSTNPADIATTNNQSRFNPAPQLSPNESLFANFLPTTMNHPIQAGNVYVPSRSQPPPPQPSNDRRRMRPGEENWGPFFLRLFGNSSGQQRNATSQQSSSDSNTDHSTDIQNQGAVQSMNLPRAMQNPITLSAMGQRNDVVQDTVNNPFTENSTSPLLNSPRNGTGTGSNNNHSGARTSHHLDSAIFPSISVNHNNGSTIASPSLSTNDHNHRRQLAQLQHQRQQEMDAVFGRTSVPLSPEIQANRRQFMDEYREIQDRLGRMNDPTNRSTSTHHTTATTNSGGHTSETAIEITEDDDDDDGIDDVIVVT
jgi:hypothetical protein